MIKRILVAVDDSPAGLAAARFAMDLARVCGAEVRAATVLVDGLLEAALAGMPGHLESSDALRARRGGGQTALLRHVVELGHARNLEPETTALVGEPARCILDEARGYRPDVLVIGRSDRRETGQPYVGSEVRQVLEFAEQPVLVVPADGSLRTAPS
jgi:nucleotide-binding universal stress UspA family protein